MGIDHMVLYVADMQRAKEFYAGKLGLSVPYEDKDMVQVQGRGSFSLLLETEEGRTIGGDGFQLQLLVDDVDAEYERLRAKGVEFDSPPEDMWWGSRHAFFKDPDGYGLTIFKPAAEAAG
jgi:catechol 2,3-dioxygenase-like lactoylglutathione lyase family enzyme